MNSHKRIFLWVAGGLGFILLALLLVLTVVAPELIRDESTKARIRREFFKAVGGSLDFDRLGISLFPRPGVVVHGASITIPETGRGTFESVKVCPWILPLLRGNVKIGKLVIERPAFEVDLRELPGLRKERPEPDASRSLEQKVASLFEGLASKAPDLNIELERGGLELLDEGQTVLSIRDLDASVLLPPGGPKVRITCTSNLWQDLSIDGRLDAKDLDGGGRIELSRFQPHLLADRFFPDAGVACSESNLYLRVDVRTEGLSRFLGELKTSIPQMTLVRNEEESALKVDDLGITFAVEEGKTELYLDQLKLGYPRLSMSGKFSMDRPTPDFCLELEARKMDVDSVREAALCLGGDVRLVRDIFDYVRGGQIPAITFRSQAEALDQLGKDEAFRIEGRLENGKIHIRGPSLDPEAVYGDVVISNGFLEGENLEARLGNSTANHGKLRVGLKGKDAPFHLEIMVDADLAEVQPILMRVVKPGTFVRELALVENIDGRSQGKLTLGERLQSVRAKVDVSKCRISADYQRIPHAIRVEAGEVFYETDGIAGRNMSGTLGNSSFSGLTCRVLFAEAPRLEIESGQFRLLMDEIYPWLISYETIRDDLKLFRDVKGRMNIAGMHLSGPVLKPADWEFEAEATLEDLTVDAPRLCPKPVPIATGGLKATPNELSFDEVKARLLDAPMNASGILYGYLRGLAKAEVDLKGTIGLESSQWVSGIIHLPPALSVRTPFPLANARLVWNRDAETSFKGDFEFPRGAKASIDLVKGPQVFMLNRLSIRDQESRATFSLTRNRDALGLKFTGNLEYATMDRVFFSNPAPEFHMKGDFLLNVRLDKPAFSKAQGHLEANGFAIPYNWLSLFEIEGLSLEASEQGLRVEPAHLTLEESHIFLEGDLKFAPEGIQVDMDLASDGIEWDAIERVIDRAKADVPVDKDAPSSGPRFAGTVRCRTESFTYGPFNWRPLHGSVTFSPDDLRVAVTEADICGISTLGAVNLDGEDLSLDFKLITQDGDLEPAFPCLSDTERQVTGRFDLSGDIQGKAKGDALIRALQGDLEFSSRDGNILKDPVLAKVFSFLNVTEILRGKVPDLRSNDLPYDSLTVKADLQDGSLVLKEAILSGPTVGIVGDGTVYLVDKKVDLKLVVAPLRTVDFIVEKTPVVSNIMGGKLLTVPVRIAGDWRDPNVSALSATAVGSRLFEIMKNTLMLPVDLVEPVLPKQDERQRSP